MDVLLLLAVLVKRFCYFLFGVGAPLYIRNEIRSTFGYLQLISNNRLMQFALLEGSLLLTLEYRPIRSLDGKSRARK